MEIQETEDNFTIGPEGKPSKVTDYKLFYPKDFKKIQLPDMDFKVDENYTLTGFSLDKARTHIINDLRGQKRLQGDKEHGLVIVEERNSHFITKEHLSGKEGIGYQVIPNVPIADYFHTHSILEGESEESFSLFSAFDLMAMGAKGAKRFWLIGKEDWSLVNLYGQQYYYGIKDATWELANKYSPRQDYKTRLRNLVNCVNQCNFRLYKNTSANTFKLVS